MRKIFWHLEAWRLAPVIIFLAIKGSQAEEQLMCIACGFPKVSPDNDVYGSYGVEAGYKRYNHSCEEYDALDKPGADPFVRICPVGVKSCFYITGKFQDAELIFRGCAEAMYQHDYGCDTDLQQVDVINQRGVVQQVDVEVNICFCNSMNCNEVLSGADRGDVSRVILLLLLVGLYSLK